MVKLEITLNDDGSINVIGPLANKHMCYGLLDCARDVVKDHSDKQNESKIALVNQGLIMPSKTRQ